MQTEKGEEVSSSDSQVRITALTTTGDGCPAGTYSTSINAAGTIATLGFDAYQAAVGPGVPGSDREKHCELFVTLRYPVGCTVATLTTTHHGFALAQSGVSATIASTYNLSPGSLTNGSPASTVLSGAAWVNGDTYTRNDVTPARVSVVSQQQRDVSFTVRSRLFVSANSSTREGLVTADDVTLTVTSQAAC
ncbi:unnamed protein product [Parascedosporium putredinis]|uniref:Secreted protein n=1 Tax=Parascedosporium putredinis TaxID=1442378 RepID=A0A9P1GX05_9PEZI|nr:unnamed protein product [Parascedosporium putredinis]CAI7990100.1 unnamed protein product [Parascedosporium putredinis]